MQAHQTIGAALIAAGVLDAGIAVWLPSRVPDERQRGLVRTGLLVGAAVMVVLGGLFLSGMIGAGR